MVTGFGGSGGINVERSAGPVRMRVEGGEVAKKEREHRRKDNDLITICGFGVSDSRGNASWRDDSVRFMGNARVIRIGVVDSREQAYPENRRQGSNRTFPA